MKTRPDDWELPAFDLTSYIGEVNRMKASLPVLNEEGPQRAIPLGDGQIVCLLRRAMRGPAWTATLINPGRRAIGAQGRGRRPAGRLSRRSKESIHRHSECST